MSLKVHDRIEAIAGAIALGEATDEERREYREHIASCPACLDALGGEHEIERVAATVAAARESEVWQPELRDVVDSRLKRRNRALRYGVSIGGFCLAISLGVHALAVSGIPTVSSNIVERPAISTAATRVVLDQRVAVAVPKPTPAAQRRMIVEHNIVQIARAPIATTPSVPPSKPDAKPQDIATITVHAQPQRQPRPHKAKCDVPVWRCEDQPDTWHTVATTTTTSMSESAPQTLTHRAESIQVFSSHSTRDALPIGGETSINPQPPMIAYDEGAEGTSVFEVLIDERGTPTKCVITKSAGYSVLDSAVCKAAMQARYTPKTIDGRAVPGVYRDAFTFRMSPDQTVEGIPKPIQ